MFSIPLYSLLIIFAIFLLIFLIFMAINIRDVISSHALNKVTAGITIGVVALAIAAIATGMFLLRHIDWSENITLIELSGSKNTDNF